MSTAEQRPIIGIVLSAVEAVPTTRVADVVQLPSLHRR